MAWLKHADFTQSRVFELSPTGYVLNFGLNFHHIVYLQKKNVCS